MVSRARYPVRYMISAAAYPDRYVVAPEVFLFLMCYHLERRHERCAISPGTSSWSPSALTCIVILTVTRSHPERDLKRYMLATDAFPSQAKNKFRGSPLERHRDRYLISHATSSNALRGLTRMYPDRYGVSPAASYRPVHVLSWSFILLGAWSHLSSS